MAIGFVSTRFRFVGEKDDTWLRDCALNPQVTMLEPKSRLHSLEPQPPISRGGKERRSRKAVSAQHAAPALDKRAEVCVGLQIRRRISQNRK